MGHFPWWKLLNSTHFYRKKSPHISAFHSISEGVGAFFLSSKNSILNISNSNVQD